MSQDLTGCSDQILAALRRVGSVLPDAKPLVVRGVDVPTSTNERKYWHVRCGSFDTMVDERDAHNAMDAVIAAMHPLQNWYICDVVPDGVTRVCLSVGRNEYLKWLTKGVS
jgi:hypothetical protein